MNKLKVEFEGSW